MNKGLVDKLAMWLRRKHPGTIVRMREFLMLYLSESLGMVAFTATLRAVLTRANGEVLDLGVVGTHKITDAFVEALVDTLQSSVATFSDYKYHDSGTGSTAEAATDTVLDAPCGEARDTGTQTEGGTANIYESVATHTYAGPFAITEHGLFNDPTTGILMDRSVITAINVESGDKITWTYQLTCVSGG